ncbi:MAG: mechanosensitive ion channel family protein, partial [Hyphomicrobiales bacterium]|nr:mechanosensitive ion channel family protein [Hyphomicrobiales bacterium]
VTYDSDIEKARKIVKKVGEELAREPELAAGILEPLKMQGVEALGDFAVQLRLKMKTRPGDVQFIARRQALGLIKNAFDKNGIKFAYPTVQVAGVSPGASDEAVSASVAQKGLELVKPAKGV